MSFSVENWLAHFDMERQKWKRKLYFSSFEKGTKFKNLFFSFPKLGTFCGDLNEN